MKFKVAYFAFSEEYGGRHAGFTHSYNIIRSLSKLVNIVAFFSSGKRKISDPNIYSVIFPNLKSISKFSFVNYVRSYFLVKNKIKDVALVHERFHVNPIDLFFIGDRKYVLEINDPAMLLHDNFFYRFLIDLKLKRCDFIVTQTNTLKNIFSKYTNKPIFVVSNGVDTSLFKPNIKTNVRKELGVSKNDVMVIFVGAFMQWHGINDVIELAKRFENVKFLIIGTGPEFENVKKNSSYVKNLVLLGSKPSEDIPKYLAAADICIAPFNTKKFTKLDDYGFWWCPVKLFEYMAAGKPVVSYDYDEVKNIIKDGGLLAKAGDFQDFSNKLDSLINNLKLRLKLGRRARKIALSYNWNYRANEIYEVYKKCLG